VVATADATPALWIVGQTDSPDFPVSQDAAYPNPAGGTDVFLVRLDLETGAPTYGTYIGGSGSDRARDLLIEPDGSVVVLGDTVSSDFPAFESDGDGSLDGPSDLFVTRFTAAGAVSASRFVGGSADEFGGGLAGAASGSVWVVGSSDSTDLPATTGAVGPSNAGGFDAVAVELSADLAQVLVLTYFGGSADDRGTDVDLPPGADEIALLGSTESDDFPVDPDAVSTIRRNRDLFVAKISADGTERRGSTYLGGAGIDSPFRIRAEEGGAVIAAGSSMGGGFPTTPGAADLVGAPQCNPYCFSDATLARLNATLTTVQYSTYLASANGDDAQDLFGTTDVVLTGSTGGADFPTTPGAFAESRNLGEPSSASDAFVSRIDATASQPLVRLDAMGLSWDPLDGADGYDVVRGDLTRLRNSAGDWSLAVDACVADDTTATSEPLVGTPAPGEGWWVLVRAVRAGTPTSWDTAGGTQVGTRDDGLRTAAACP
jgi:hypothetical protein